MKNKTLVIVVLIIFAAGALLYMNNSKTLSSEPVTESSAMPAPSTPDTTEMIAEEQVKEITVEGSEFTFSPATLTLKKGEKARLTLKNTGKMPHDFVVDELSVQTKTITSGEQDVVEFTPDKIGTFEYYCSIGQHRANGMTGMLTVE